ncbi:MAG: CHAT domain-containing protein [Myxococcota bacterium]
MRCLALLLAVSCADESTPAAAPLNVLSTCTVRADRCGHADEVRVWVEGARATFWIDGVRATSDSVAVQGGHRTVLPIPEGARRLEIRRGAATSSRALTPKVTSATLLELGDERSTTALARIQEALHDASGSERAALLSRAGRIALTLGDDEGAIRFLSDALALHRTFDEPSEAVLDAVAIAWIHHRRQWRFDDAATVLQRVESLHPTSPVPAARAEYHRAYILAESGEPRLAERALRGPAETATKLGVSQLIAQTAIYRAELLHRLGRREAAHQVLREVEPHLDGCLAGDHATTQGWLAILDAEDGGELPSASLEEARRVYETCDANAEQRANAALNLALAALHRGQIERAETWLAEARHHGGGAVVYAWSLELTARRHLSAGRADEARLTYEELATRARLAGALSSQWRATVGQGVALEALGRPRDAIAAYTRAEEILDREATALSLGTAPGFTGRRWRSASRLAGLLLSERPDQALAVLRQARLRALPKRGPSRNEVIRYREARRTFEADAGTAWTLPRAELSNFENQREELQASLHTAVDDAYRESRQSPRTSRADEQLLMVFPHHAGRIVILEGEQTQGAIVGESEWPSFVEEALDQDLRVLGAGRYAFVWPPVRARIVHALDIETTPSEQRGSLVVVDPSGNLQGAREEGERAERHWEARMLKDNDATLEAVTRLLSGVNLFHYAGHASHAEDLSAGLHLTDGAILSAADVLALPHVPRSVILNGCESGSGSGLVPIGVAQSFVAAGSERVIGAIRPVQDAEALALANRLFESTDPATWVDHLVPDGASASPFRLFVP